MVGAILENAESSCIGISSLMTPNYLFSFRNTKYCLSISQVGVLENAKTFKDDPAKQQRFELFLKDKYKGGLRSTQPSGIMSEDDRARERLDFEAAAEAIEKGEHNPLTASRSMGQLMDFSGSIEQQFISSTGPTVSLFLLKL